MPTKLEFRPCPNCGKSIPNAAYECYRCRQSVESATLTKKWLAKEEDEPTSSDHAALEHGGYSVDDDEFDYEEFIDREFNDGQDNGRRFRLFVIWFIIVAFTFPIVFGLVQLVFSY